MTPTLVDASVWIDHLRRDNERLASLLMEGLVWIHPFVIGELACGNLQDRANRLAWLSALPHAIGATHDEAKHLLETYELHGSGIGWVDVNLLTSARLSQIDIWTMDEALASAAEIVEVLSD
ncbi:MAG: VapC toxin family PIN domain ribonuclease [Acidimicrobiia bacterium]|nr:VapC toxin family PIN domain ribonuclease [Acidimicrobiia bacterium]